MANREVLEPRFYKKYDSRGVSCRVNRKGFVREKFWWIIVGVVGVGKKDNFGVIFAVNFFREGALNCQLLMFWNIMFIIPLYFAMFCLKFDQ